MQSVDVDDARRMLDARLEQLHQAIAEAMLRPWWMRMHVFGLTQVPAQFLIAWFLPVEPVWPSVVFYMLGAVSTAFWVAGQWRLRQYRRWYALHHLVGVPVR
jgi:hypothetical protein